MNSKELKHFGMGGLSLVPMEEPASSLFHYGVKGQRWGVRRYQNADGTRTPLGKRVEDKANTRMSKGKNLTSMQKKILKRMSEDDDRRINIKAAAEAEKEFIKKNILPGETVLQMERRLNPLWPKGETKPSHEWDDASRKTLEDRFNKKHGALVEKLKQAKSDDEHDAIMRKADRLESAYLDIQEGILDTDWYKEYKKE